LLTRYKYLRLSENHLKLFKNVLQKLRPLLDYLAQCAYLLDDALLKTNRAHQVTFRLQDVKPETILEQQLDSDILLHSLDPLPLSEEGQNGDP